MTINNLKLRSPGKGPGVTHEPESDIYRIAIIGGGPKGIYGLERLLAFLQAEKTAVPVAIHCFNRSPHFGAGDVYRPDQPEFLIMNFSNGRINMWPEEQPKPVVTEPLSFVDWLRMRGEHAAPQAYASRAKVGEYLMDGFDRLNKQCPAGTRIYTHTGEVTDLIPEGDLYFLEMKTPTGKSRFAFPFQQLLLTTGHPRPHSSFPELTFGGEREQHKLENQLIPTIYPVRERLSDVRARENVLIKGLGLTFIDAVLALTEGRGGNFTGTVTDGLSYQPSGLEPHKILPFSRTGLPMFPRTGEIPDTVPELIYFTPHKLDQLPARENGLDFRKDLLPLIEREIRVSYYRVLFQHYGLELEVSEDFAKVEEQIELFHTDWPDETCFYLENLLSPLPQPALGLHASFVAYLDECLEAAKLGPEKSPLAAAAARWRAISPVFNEYYSFGGLSPDGQREFLTQYAGHFNRLAYGPPVENLEKIRALAAAGLLDFSFARSPHIEYREELACFLITHPHHQRQSSAVYWINARIPKVQIGKDTSALYQNLLKRGLIRVFRNSDGASSFCPGCMDLDLEGHPRDVRGRPVAQITVYGTPTEGITYDNDTLSRTRNNFVDHWAGAVVQEIKTKKER